MADNVNGHPTGKKMQIGGIAGTWGLGEAYAMCGNTRPVYNGRSNRFDYNPRRAMGLEL